MIILADAVNPLPVWQNFYNILGSSAGALIGLQFVVIALIASTRMRANLESINAFGTPNVVHFAAVLAVSAIVSAPWGSLRGVSIVLAIIGVAGLIYAVIVFRRALRQTLYKPLIEDWAWYVILPCVAYVVLAVGAICLRIHLHAALFTVAGASLALLFVGIHNAWDTVTHIVITTAKDDEKVSQ